MSNKYETKKSEKVVAKSDEGICGMHVRRKNYDENRDHKRRGRTDRNRE